MLYAIAAVGLGYGGVDARSGEVLWAIDWLDPLLMGQVALATALIVGGASLFRVSQLSGGGRAVAESLGGRLLDAGSRDAAERKLLNVVEEMAIASGTPTPPVYMMDREQGINAFAAGFTPQDAVIGVTRGCAEQLSRDQLQGVIAHEFSHILNGDMRLNIRLMGILYGILVIGLIGQFLLRSSFWAGATSRRSRDNSALAMAAIGFAVMLIGFIGSFFGSLIKASVSRQREFLADASAVQFTRDPQGIAGALQKIAGLPSGSRLAHPNADEASHLFFGQPLASGLQSLFATHPPLAERIRRLDPSWQPPETATAEPAAAGVPPGAAGFANAALSGAVARVGRLDSRQIQLASALRDRLPAALLDAAREPYGARALIYSLLIDRDADARAQQRVGLERLADAHVLRLVAQLLPLVESLDTGFRLPLIDLALPALRQLSVQQYRRFAHVIEELVAADQRIDLFEWTLQRILRRHLASHFEGRRRERRRITSPRRLASDCAVVFAILARANAGSQRERENAFADALRALGLPAAAMPEPEQSGLERLDRALDALDALAPECKRQLLSACAELIASDGRVAETEAELFRAISDSLGCPVAPLLPSRLSD